MNILVDNSSKMMSSSCRNNLRGKDDCYHSILSEKKPCDMIIKQELSQDEALHALYVLYMWYHKKTDLMGNCT